MKILINLFIIYFLISHFSLADHHLKNKQDQEDNSIDDILLEMDEIEHDHSSHDGHEDNSENDDY